MQLNELESAEAAIKELDPRKPGVGLYFLAEMWRVAAEVSLRRNGQAEQTLNRICSAIDTARLQGATTLELRARAWKVAHLGSDSEEELKAVIELAATVALDQGYDHELLASAEAACSWPSI